MNWLLNVGRHSRNQTDLVHIWMYYIHNRDMVFVIEYLTICDSLRTKHKWKPVVLLFTWTAWGKNSYGMWKFSISKCISTTLLNAIGRSIYSSYAKFGKQLLPFCISEYETDHLKWRVSDVSRTGAEILYLRLFR